jgi:hypothetical protein
MSHEIEVEQIVKTVIAQSGIPASVEIVYGINQMDGQLPDYANIFCHSPEEARDLEKYLKINRPEWGAQIYDPNTVIRAIPVVKWNGYKVIEQLFDQVNNQWYDLDQTGPYPINGAWYLDALPGCVIVECENGQLGRFALTPFRKISENDILQYKGYHPRHCKGQPLPEYLYSQYGLAKSSQTLSAVLPTTRLYQADLEKIQRIAKQKNMSISELIRSMIHDLEDPEGNE